MADAAGVTSVQHLVYRAAGDMRRALRDIAAAGYAGVEMVDSNVADSADGPGDLRGPLDATGLVSAGVYTGANFVYDELLPDELHRIRRAAGIPESDYDRLAGALDTADALAAEHGLSACSHPHLGTIAQDPDQVGIVFARSRIGFCPDTAYLAAGGGDPVELIRPTPTGSGTCT